MNSETIDLPHGYKAEIAIDESPENPFWAFDCDPPIAVYYDRHFGHPCGRKEDSITLADLFDLLPESRFRSRAGRGAIADAAGVDLGEVETPEKGNRTPEAWRWAIREALPETPGYYSSVSDYFDCMEAVAGLAGVPCYRGESRGYSQGDWAAVFVAATPAWAKEVGAPKESLARQCKGTFDLYTAWAWGDVYGVSEIIRPNGEEMADGSCWGFYGSDHEASGLMEHCRSIVEFDRKERAEKARSRREYLKRERREARDAACRDIATV